MKHYFYSDGEKQKGPFTFEQLKNENIKKETLIWFEGLDDWKPAKEIQELDEIFELIPPPIPKNEFDREHESTEPNYEREESNDTRDESESFVRQKQGMFSKPFSFEGRIRRTEYGVTFIIYFVIALIINVIMESGEETAILGLAYIPMLWFLWAQGAKRCHDIGHSGWYQIIPFYMLWMIFAKGEEGIQNKYGVNPKF